MKILIADKFETTGMEALSDKGFDIVFEPSLSGDALVEAMSSENPDFLIVRSTKVTAEAIDAASNLKIIVRAGAGFDTIDIKAAGAKKVAVCNCPGTNSTAVAELVIGLMVCIDRRIPSQVMDFKNGVWNKSGYGKARGLKGLTLGIVGLGQIGRLVAKRALAMEMKVVYSDVYTCQEFEGNPNVQRVEFDELLKTSDYITLHVPGGSETDKLINKENIAKMKKNAAIINTSRGSVVNGEDLYNALTNGDLAFAALDVHPNEPKATDTTVNSPFQSLPNFYGTHHVGASTEQAQQAVAERVVEILSTYADKKEILFCVNKEHMA